MSNQANIGSYCYDLTLSKIQFNSDTSKWSPNNVRRIFISGDGTCVQYFVGTIKGSYGCSLFNPTKAVNCFCDKGFKPIISCLIDLVCSNIEEIVFCTKSLSGVNLNQSELNLSAILKGYSGAMNPDLAKSLLGRFVRLRSICIYNGDLQSVVGMLDSGSLKNPVKLFGEIAPNCSVQLLNNENWYKSRRLRPQIYSFDCKNGKLDKYFETVQESYESKLRESKINEINKGRYGKKEDEVRMADALASKFVTCLKKYASCSQKTEVDANLLTVNLRVPKGDYSKLVSSTSAEVLSHGVQVDCKETMEFYELLIESLKCLAQNCYTQILSLFFNAVASYEDRMVTLNIKMKGFNAGKVVVPVDVFGRGKAEELLSCSFKVGITGSVRELKASACYIMVYLCKLVIPRSQAKNVAVYNKKFWEDIIFDDKEV